MSRKIMASIYIAIGLLGLSAPLSAKQTTNLAVDVSKYLVGPEDVLEISVWKEKDLTREVLVRPDGRLSFPLAGEIEAAGHTAMEIQDEITNRIKKYMPDPVVTVLITKLNGYKIYVIGQVNKPGLYAIGRYLDVMQALAMAGGLTPFASENNIRILRRENGKNIVIPFEYGSVKKGNDLEQNIVLRSDDVVVVQ